MKWLLERLRAVPHLFGKVMVIWCVSAGTVCSVGAVYILLRTGRDAAGLLVPILAFFGGELALMFGKNALKQKQEDERDGSDKCA